MVNIGKYTIHGCYGLVKLPFDNEVVYNLARLSMDHQISVGMAYSR